MAKKIILFKNVHNMVTSLNLKFVEGLKLYGGIADVGFGIARYFLR